MFIIRVLPGVSGQALGQRAAPTREIVASPNGVCIEERQPASPARRVRWRRQLPACRSSLCAVFYPSCPPLQPALPTTICKALLSPGVHPTQCQVPLIGLNLNWHLLPILVIGILLEVSVISRGKVGGPEPKIRRRFIASGLFGPPTNCSTAHPCERAAAPADSHPFDVKGGM